LDAGSNETSRDKKEWVTNPLLSYVGSFSEVIRPQIRRNRKHKIGCRMFSEVGLLPRFLEIFSMEALLGQQAVRMTDLFKLALTL
jgi:hypothetical protein